MNNLKKVLFIPIGCMLMILGAAAAIFLLFIDNIDSSSRALAFTACLAAVILGWWMVRRVSKSLGEAVAWLLLHLWP